MQMKAIGGQIIMPEEQKNNEYWMKRRKNNEAARRSREKRKMNDVLLERRVMILTEENKQLRAQLLAIKMKYGELNDLCVPLSSSVALTNDFYDNVKYDVDSSENSIDMQSLMSQTKDLSESRSGPRLFTSKVFTNASGDTSATVHVNKLSGNPKIHGNKFVFADFSTISENSQSEDRANLGLDIDKCGRATISNFSERALRESAISKQAISMPSSKLNGDERIQQATDYIIPNSFKKSERLSSILHGEADKREEEAALLLAGKFNYDILKTVNIDHQVPLADLSLLTKEAMGKIEYSYHQARNEKFGTTNINSSPVLSAEIFLKNLRLNKSDSPINNHDITNKTNSTQQHEAPSITVNNVLHISDKVPSPINNETPETITPSSAPFTVKRHLLNEVMATNEEPDTKKHVCDAIPDDTHKKSSVQLPHKLRLKKSTNFDTSQLCSVSAAYS
ncbi:uncharacterized protein LOC120342761 isoform X1 [Styela clava]